MDIKRPYKNNQTHGAHFGIFSGMALVSNGAENNRPPQAKAARGLMHHPAFVAVATTAEQAWRTLNHHWPPELCLKNLCLRGLALWKVLFSRMNRK